MRKHADHSPIDGAGTTAAAGDQYGQFGGIQAKNCCAVFTLSRQDFAADGIAREDHFILWEMSHGLFCPCCNPGHEARQEFIRDTRHDILFLYEGRDMHEAGCQQDRATDISAGTDCNIGMEAAHDARSLGHPNHGTTGAQQILWRQMTLKALNINGREGQALLRDDIASKPRLVPT